MKAHILKALALGVALLLGGATGCSGIPDSPSHHPFVTIEGDNLISPTGEKLTIMGTNLGNWLNPEGYMFGFSKTNSPWMIDLMLRELVGPDRAAEFWRKFKDCYITKADIDFIASCGATVVRLPFNYRIFTDEDYMGLSDNSEEGFERVDALVQWCREAGLYLILDMHDCPGGQTGDNIDDSYAYPWLFESERSQDLFCEVWKKIALHYRNESVILGYELMNEPIAPYFDTGKLNALLEPLYKKAVSAIREVDPDHIILLGGAQWNGNFEPFTDWTFDSKIMYTCHRYGGEPTPQAIEGILKFKEKTGLPMYMGEIGHNTTQWQWEFVRTMKNNNIGYTFWPYKKIYDSCFVGFDAPSGWDKVVAFSESPRGTYQEIRSARPAQEEAWGILEAFLRNVKFSSCHPQQSYISSLQMK